ncbi:MAG: hypothetical protein K8R19_09595 [Methanosarcinales archaeon]|nr:hypothetical protein [Methanosarcinales archaeon]
MINTECGMQCPHCDLPVKYNNNSKHLDEKQWQSILENILPAIKPEVVAIAAREPLYNSASRKNTKTIIEVSKKHNICHHRSKNQPKSSFTNQPERSKGAPMRLVLFKKTHKSLSSFQEKNLGNADHQIAKLIINLSNLILRTLFQGRGIIALFF